MPTITTLTDRNGHRVQADLGLDCRQLDVGTAIVRPAPRIAMRRSRLDTAARWALLTAYAIAGVALTLWALLSRGPFY